MRLRPAIALIVVYGLVLTTISSHVHPMIAWLTAEFDDYIGAADQILQGMLPKDGYRPLLYPLLTAALAPLCTDTFLAAKIVSAAAAGVMIVASFALARELFGTTVGCATGCFVATHPLVIVHGMIAATDSLFAAFVTMTLYLTIKTAVDRRARWVIALALSFAAAYWTRYTAQLLLVPVAFSLLWPRYTIRRGGRLFRVAVFLGAVCVFLLPHFLLTHYQFGRILFDENLKNFSFKNFGSYDMPFASWAEAFTHAPWTVLAKSVETVQGFLRGLPGDLVGGSRPWHWSAWATCILLAIGGVYAIRSRPLFLLPAGFAVAYLLALCVTFWPQPRMELAVLPIGMIGVAAPLLRINHGSRRVLGVAYVVAILIVFALNVPGAVQRFLSQQHPQAELQELRALSHEYPNSFIGAPTAILRHHLPVRDAARIRYVIAPFNVEWSVAEYLEKIRPQIEKYSLDFVVLGRFGVGQRLLDALDLELQASNVSPVFRRAVDVLVLRTSEVIESLVIKITPNPFVRGVVTISVDIEQAQQEAIVGAFAIVRSRDAEHAVPLHKYTAAHYSNSFAPAELLPGTWEVRACVINKSGHRMYGPAAEWRVLEASRSRAGGR